MKRVVLLIFISLIFGLNIDAQAPCPDPISPAINDVNPGCTICEFPIQGSTNGYTAGPLVNGNYGCGNLTIENEQYITFIANQPTVSFVIDAFNCSAGSPTSILVVYKHLYLI